MPAKHEVESLVLALWERAAELPPSAAADDVRAGIEALIGILGFEVARERPPAA